MPSNPCIAVDAMGGDFGVDVNVPAAVNVAEQGVDVILVGDGPKIEAELKKARPRGLAGIEVVHASQVVGMDEKPADAMRRKKDSSISIACKLVKNGQADGLISAGNSGATVAGAIFVLGRIRGIERPALASIMPSEKKPVVLLDVGANVDCKPFQLAQYGIMGDVLARCLLRVDKPTVGLLSIGEEEGKGNTVTKEAFELLKKANNLNFVGNVEGRDLYTGEINVVVCDGFVGNVALKVSEGVAKSFGHLLKGELKRDLISRLGALLMMPTLSRFARMMDYAEYGGAPLLGVKGSVMVCHGASNVKAIASAIKMAARYVTSRANAYLVEGLEANTELAQFARARANGAEEEPA